MKILFVIDNLISGGAQRQVVTLAQIFKIKGYDVSVMCYAQEDFFAKDLIEADIPIYWEIESNYLKRIFRVRRFIRNGKYKAVISFLYVPNFLNCFAAVGGKNWKVITSERSAKREVFKTIKGKIFAWYQRYSDTIVCNSYNAKNMWIEYYPQYKDKLGVIYNPVILPKITSKYTPKRDGKLHIVVAASYQYLKNPIGLIKALALLNVKQRKQIKIDWYGRKQIIVGDTRAYNESESLIAKYNLQDVIHLNDSTKDIINIMNEADVVALFSKVEGLPNTICEGIAIGKPIIMTRVSDYSVLVNNENGFLCDSSDVESIKNAIVCAIETPIEKLVSMGNKSKEKAERLFSKEEIINQWESLIYN